MKLSTTSLPGPADPLVVFGSIDVRRKLDVHFYAPNAFWIRFDELPYRFVPMKPTRHPGPVLAPVVADVVDDRGPDAGLIT